jgi:hypothetical protein
LTMVGFADAFPFLFAFPFVCPLALPFAFAFLEPAIVMGVMVVGERDKGKE